MKSISIPVLCLIASISIFAVATNAKDETNSANSAALSSYPEQDAELKYRLEEDGHHKLRLTVGSDKRDKEAVETIIWNRLSPICADLDGCEVRIGRYNDPEPGLLVWYDTARLSITSNTFSAPLDSNREGVKWVATYSGTYRKGMSNDLQFQALFESNGCHLVDGSFDGVGNQIDQDKNFGIYVTGSTQATCVMSFID